MNKHLKIAVLIVIMLVLSIGIVYSQAGQYTFIHLTRKDGLSMNNVRDVFKDSRGFMWFSTQAGINRYDGYEFKVYKYDPEDTASVSGNNFSSNITEDRQGNLWIGTHAQGLNRYNPATDKFTRFPFDPNDPGSISCKWVSATYMDYNDVIWIGTYNGLNRFDNNSKDFTVFKQIPQDSSNLVDQITTIYEDCKNIFWIGTCDGLYLFDRGMETFTPFEFKPKLPENWKSVRCIFEDHEESIWIGTDVGLYRYMRSSRDMDFYSIEDSSGDYLSSTVNDMAESFIGGVPELWISTRDGLNRFDYKTNTFKKWHYDPGDTFSLSTSILKSLYLDDNGLLWIASYNGVNILNINENVFTQICEEPWRKDFRYTMKSFYQSKSGDYWIGTHSSGLYHYDPNLRLINHFLFPDDYNPSSHSVHSKNNLTYLFVDSDNTFWVGVFDLGAHIFNRSTNQLDKVSFITPEGSIKPTRIRLIYEDRKGVLWFSTNFGLYFRKEDSSNDSIVPVQHPVLSQCGMSQLLEDRNGDLWIGTRDRGLYYLPADHRATDKFLQYEYEPTYLSIYDPSVWDIFEDSEGTLWFATLGAIYYKELHSDSLTKYDRIDHLCLKNTYVILEDNSRNLWLSGRYGLYRFKPWELPDHILKLYDIEDGLPFNDLGYFSFFRDNNGKFLLGGQQGSNSGFVYFYPDSIKNNIRIPPVAITDFKVRNDSYSLDSNIIYQKTVGLKYNENFFSFEFTALNFTNPGKNKYAYKLDGLDEEWIYSGNRRFANYTGVPPGNYTFRVKGSNHNGYWNEEGSSIQLTISPPPWGTWWAYCIYILILILLFFAWRRYDLKRHRLKKQLEIEHIEKEKLGELDSMKSRFFANVSHEFRTPLTLILGPLGNLKKEVSSEKGVNDLDIIKRNALRLQQLINQLLNLSKLESGKMKLQAREQNILQLVRGYTQNFESLAKQKSIKLEIKSELKEFLIWIDRDKIEKILYNLLSNAFKYTDSGGAITVQVGRSSIQHPASSIQDNVKISVSDTGSGIDADKLPHIFDRFYQAEDASNNYQEGTGIGLALTKELVELHHGEITVSSKEGEGSTFLISLPLGDTHLSADEKASIDEQVPSDKSQLSDSQTVIAEMEGGIHLLQDEDEISDTSKAIILIIENNPDLRSYIRGQLERNYNILEAYDGKQGFSKAVDFIPDLILSDVMMPEMDGYELCARVKSDERTSHIPLVLLTARAAPESRIEGLETGADDFITKPFDPEELHIRIRNLIKQRKRLKEKFLRDIHLEGIQDGSKNDDEALVSIDQKFLVRARETVKKYLSDESFDITIFSSEMNLSRTQLHRKLRALIDQSATEFIRTVRLNHAATLLKHKTGNISEIALDVGFSNPGYFAECFKKQFSILPSEYAKKFS